MPARGISQKRVVAGASPEGWTIYGRGSDDDCYGVAWGNVDWRRSVGGDDRVVVFVGQGW